MTRALAVLAIVFAFVALLAGWPLLTLVAVSLAVSVHVLPREKGA